MCKDRLIYNRLHTYVNTWEPYDTLSRRALKPHHHHHICKYLYSPVLYLSVVDSERSHIGHHACREQYVSHDVIVAPREHVGRLTPAGLLSAQTAWSTEGAEGWDTRHKTYIHTSDKRRHSVDFLISSQETTYSVDWSCRNLKLIPSKCLGANPQRRVQYYTVLADTSIRLNRANGTLIRRQLLYDCRQ